VIEYVKDECSHMVKLKVNSIVEEPANSYLCGYYCIRFIEMRDMGISFKHATGFYNMNENEKEI